MKLHIILLIILISARAGIYDKGFQGFSGFYEAIHKKEDICDMEEPFTCTIQPQFIEKHQIFEMIEHRSDVCEYEEPHTCSIIPQFVKETGQPLEFQM